MLQHGGSGAVVECIRLGRKAGMEGLFTDIPNVNAVCLCGHCGITGKVGVVSGVYGLVVFGLLGESTAEIQLKWLADGRARRGRRCHHKRGSCRSLGSFKQLVAHGAVSLQPPPSSTSGSGS